MFRVLILDDEQNAWEYLKSVIEKHIPKVDEVFATSDIHEAQVYLDHKKPQLVFLDVEMPLMSGFDFLSMQKEKNFDVIFSTAFSKYAIQAIRFSALDFLLKPVQTDELMAAFDRFFSQPVESERKQKMYEHLFENLNTNNEQAFKLSLSKGSRTYFVPPADVYFCSAYSNYTNIYLKDHTEFTVSKTLKEFEEMLNVHNFIRTHKSFLVNKTHVKTLNSEGHLVLNNNATVEVSRRRLEEVKSNLGYK